MKPSMFEVVARANIHHQQVVKLLKQRNRIHASLVYQGQRMATLEQSLCAHIYALLDADPDELTPEVAVLVSAMNTLSDEQLTSEKLIECFEQESAAPEQTGLPEAITLLCSLLPTTYLEKKLNIVFENAFLEDILYRNSQLLELLTHFNIAWPVEALKVVRQSVLAEQFSPSLTVACLLFGQPDVTTQALEQGYKHSQFHIAKASFVKGLTIDKPNAESTLFTRFAKTTDVEEKAELLAIAGLSGDSRWIEPCSIFCKEYPKHTFAVLSNFQHKVFLTLIIELMTVAQTTDEAYKAWLLLTNTKLLKKPQLQDNSNNGRQAGEVKIPNSDQAELSRQTLMQQPGSKVLMGISFNNNEVAQKLNGLQGQAVQLAFLSSMLFSLPNKKTNSEPNATGNDTSLYCRQLSSVAFNQLIYSSSNTYSNSTAEPANNSQQVKQGASNVA